MPAGRIAIPRLELHQERVQPRDVVAFDAINDVEIERRHRRALEDRCDPADDDVLDGVTIEGAQEL